MPRTMDKKKRKKMLNRGQNYYREREKIKREIERKVKRKKRES